MKNSKPFLPEVNLADNLASLNAGLEKMAIQGTAALPTRPPQRNLKPIKLRGKAVSRIILEERR